MNRRTIINFTPPQQSQNSSTFVFFQLSCVQCKQCKDMLYKVKLKSCLKSKCNYQKNEILVPNKGQTTLFFKNIAKVTLPFAFVTTNSMVIGPDSFVFHLLHLHFPVGDQIHLIYLNIGYLQSQFLVNMFFKYTF